jgi:starch-binding outer membrane protein, SusD/RagB family
MPYCAGHTRLLVLGILTITAGSCTDLTEIPYSEVTEDNFKPTGRDIGALMAPAYAALRPMWMGWQGNFDLQEESADALVTPPRPNGWNDGGTYIRLHQHRWGPSQGQPGGHWSNCFNGINSANRVIYQIESGLVPIGADVKPHLLAELKALRAYFYAELLDNFGNVAIVTDFADTTLPVQSTRQQVYDFVVNELTTAIPDLSAEVGSKTYGRMNRWAARGILARVYLNAEVYTGTAQWSQVIALANEIINSGLYRLEAEYRTNFARHNETSVENILAVPYDQVYARQSSFHMKTLKPELRYVFNMQAGPWGGSASNPQFIGTYDAADKRLAATWLRGPQFTPDRTFGYDFIQYMSPLTKQSPFNQGYPVWKYEIYAGMTDASDVDYPVLRYAEVLMMKAEALLRTGQGAAAADIVTQVRQRAFASADSAKAVVTGTDLLQGSSYNYGWYDEDGIVKTGPGGTPTQNGGADITYGRFLDELGWEFAVEGHRRQQLIRFGVYTTKRWFNHSPNGVHRTIFAIPQGALNTNANLRQNPGY